MSEIITTRAPAEFAGLTFGELAHRCHTAESTGDDILLLKVEDEVSRRERQAPGAERLFMDFYREQWHEVVEKSMLRRRGKKHK